jgi:hypothetical protein
MRDEPNPGPCTCPLCLQVAATLDLQPTTPDELPPCLRPHATALGALYQRLADPTRGEDLATALALTRTMLTRGHRHADAAQYLVRQAAELSQELNALALNRAVCAAGGSGAPPWPGSAPRSR